ncbi:hypothetical protein NKH77_40485 [Streptomyces sp. M19]
MPLTAALLPESVNYLAAKGHADRARAVVRRYGLAPARRPGTGTTTGATNGMTTGAATGATRGGTCASCSRAGSGPPPSPSGAPRSPGCCWCTA